MLGVDWIKPDQDSRTAAVLAYLMERPDLQFLATDVADGAVTSALREATAVVHLAAPTDVVASWSTGFADQTAGLLSWHHLLDACWTAHVPRVVVASSAHVYGPTEGLAREDVPAEPTSGAAIAFGRNR